MSPLSIVLSECAGFCWGVERALELARTAAAEAPGPVNTLGPLIHNPGVIADLRRRGVGTVSRIDEVTSGPVDDRVRHLLEGLAREHGTPFGQGRFIAIPLRRKDIACMVNATTETVSRVLARFEREGVTRSTRDGIWLKLQAAPAPASTTTVREEATDVAPVSQTAPRRVARP